MDGNKSNQKSPENIADAHSEKDKQEIHPTETTNSQPTNSQIMTEKQDKSCSTGIKPVHTDKVLEEESNTGKEFGIDMKAKEQEENGQCNAQESAEKAMDTSETVSDASSISAMSPPKDSPNIDKVHEERPASDKTESIGAETMSNLERNDSGLGEMTKDSFIRRNNPGDKSSDSDSSSSITSSDDDGDDDDVGVADDDEYKPPQASKPHSKLDVGYKLHGELGIEDLPPIEELKISVEKNERLVLVGEVASVVDVLVVVRSLAGLSPLNEDTVLFDENRIPIGKVFETIGPVTAPLYTVRFNTLQDIQSKDIKPGTKVYYAPDKREITNYVFLEPLRRVKGSDASWEHNLEPPVAYLDYSDDEQEREARRLRRKKNQSADGAMSGAEQGGAGGGMPGLEQGGRRGRAGARGPSNGPSQGRKPRAILGRAGAADTGNFDASNSDDFSFGEGKITSWPPPFHNAPPRFRPSNTQRPRGPFPPGRGGPPHRPPWIRPSCWDAAPMSGQPWRPPMVDTSMPPPPLLRPGMHSPPPLPPPHMGLPPFPPSLSFGGPPPPFRPPPGFGPPGPHRFGQPPPGPWNQPSNPDFANSWNAPEGMGGPQLGHQGGSEFGNWEDLNDQ